MIAVPRLLPALFVLLLASGAMAQTWPKVEEVRIDGTVRIPEQSVRAKIKTRVGQLLDPSVVTDDIKRIFEMGTFLDVQVGVKTNDSGGVILLYAVKERPTIARIQFKGNDDQTEEDLQKVVDVRPSQIADEVQFKKIVQKIRDLYVEEGFYLADVRFKQITRPGNTVDLIFEIEEGSKVKVTSVTFLGNSEIPDEELKGVIRTQEGGWFSFLTNSGQFKKEALETDLQIIRAYYLHKGYITVKVGLPVVTLSKDKESIDIVIPVTEGLPYSVRSVDVDGDLLFEKDFLIAKLELKPGMTFDSFLMQKDTSTLKELYQDLGYANVTISNASLQDPDKREIEFKYQIQKGEKVFIGRISYAGNETTRDKVMRRVMTISEGDLYNATAIKHSRRQIMRLGFFERADITDDPGANPALTNLTVRVKERQTGTFQVGAGFSSLENFIATAQISKQNFLGHGQTVSLQATLSSIRSLYTVSFFDPYFLDTSWTLSLDAFNFQQEFNDFSRGSFGGSMAWGYRFTEDLHLSLAYKIEDVDITIRRSVPLANGAGGGLTSSLKTVLTYDTRDDRQFPKNGMFVTGSAEVASEYLGSGNEFTRLEGRARFYFNPFWKVILKLNTTIGYVVSPDGSEVPFYERFFVGGIFDVRGFQRHSLGPEVNVASTNEPGASTSPFTTGGNKKLIFNVELEIPFLEELRIRGVLFFDAGQAFSADQNIDITELRPSVGFGIRWWSPVGPLRFEWGIPLNPNPDEEPIVFEFTIGNSF